MATGGRSDGSSDHPLSKLVLKRIELRQQELLKKLDAVEKAVEKQKYATPQFSENVLQQMYCFYKEGRYCDFEIIVQGQTYKVHRLVMASSSDYFMAMLSHDMLETQQESTDLRGMTIKGVEPLIEYCYSGRLDLSLDNIHDVFSGATFLQISSAIELCTDFLKGNMTFENAEDLLKIGDVFSVSSLKEYYRNYLLKNFLQFVESESFLNIDVDSLADYLADNALITTSESVLYHHCMRWYQHDKENREKDVHKIFEKVRMCSDGWPLISYASLREPFLSNKKCKEIMDYNEKFMENASKRYLGNSNDRTGVRSTRQTIVQFGGVMEINEEYDTIQDMMNLPSNEMIGWCLNHYFHPDLKAWFTMGVVGQSESLYSHQRFVEVNGCGVLVGGYEHINSDDSVNTMCIKDVKMFITQGSFQLWEMPDLLHERARHAAVYLNGYIYAIGGKDDRQSLSSVERLDCEKEEWTYVRQLPQRLFDHAAAVCKGKIYVSGGSERQQVKKNVWCYDPEKDRWKKMQELHGARAGHGMVCMDNFLYVAGGHNSNRETLYPMNLRCLQTVERYCPDTDQWTKMSGMKHAITFFEMTKMNGKIVVLGGLDGAGRLTQYMHEYDHEEDKWRIFGELPRPLKNACCGVVVMKLIDTGCMEDETDDYNEEFNALYEMSEEHDYMMLQNAGSCQRMMENFNPGDYLLDDEDDSDENLFID